MTPKQLKTILNAHAKWTRSEKDGQRAHLEGAHLEGAHLEGAHLERAHLEGAYLERAHLEGAYMEGAYMEGAYMEGAHLEGAHLEGAHLEGAYLGGANLRGTVGAELTIARTRILAEGDLTGWKKCEGGVIVKLRIPAAAKRSHAFGRKCRAEYAVVLETVGAAVGISQYDGITKYVAGETVRCDTWCDDYTQECAGGIHFYITRIEAENHN